MAPSVRLASFPVALALACVLAACSGNPNDSGAGSEDGGSTAAEETYAKFAAMPAGEERAQELQECAEQEGELVVNSSSNTVELLVEEFEKQFEISTERVNPTTSESQRQRLLQEHRAGETTTDVIVSNASEFTHVYSQAGVTAPYSTPVIAEDRIPEAMRTDAVMPVWFYPVVPAYNTDQVSPDDLPESYEDLASPAWEGKLGLVTGDAIWYAGLYEALVNEGDMSEQEFAEMFQAIGSNSRAFDGHGSVSLVEAGEIPLLVTNWVYSGSMELAMGDTVEFHPIEPIVMLVFGAGLTTDSPHPCSAILFTEWVMTDGQQIVADDSYYPAFVEEIEGGEAALAYSVEDYEVAYSPFNEISADDFAKWESAYDERLLQGGENVLPE